MLGWKNLLTTGGPITLEGWGGKYGNMTSRIAGVSWEALRCSCPIRQPSGVGHEVFQESKGLASRSRLDLYYRYIWWWCHDIFCQIFSAPLWDDFLLAAHSKLFFRMGWRHQWICSVSQAGCKVWLGLGKWMSPFSFKIGIFRTLGCTSSQFISWISWISDHLS